MNVTMTGGKRKVRHTACIPLRSIVMVAMLVAALKLGKKAIEFGKCKTLICMAVDEPESHCLNDGGKNAVEGLEEDDEVCLSVIGSESTAFATNIQVCLSHTWIDF